MECRDEFHLAAIVQNLKTLGGSSNPSEGRGFSREVPKNCAIARGFIPDARAAREMGCRDIFGSVGDRGARVLRASS